MCAALLLPTLGNIIRDTQDYLRNSNIRCQSPPRSTSSPAIPLICLPDPPSLYTSLIALGADPRVAKELDHVYSTRALELRSFYENSVRNACAVLTAFPLPNRSDKRVVETFTTLYLMRVKSWMEDGIASYQKCHQRVPNNGEGSDDRRLRPMFNTDYIPLLEHFFEENPLPTHADKVFLAKKSGMTYRQIHVWFQNRRNRTKKTQRNWRKKPVSEGASLPLRSLRERMGKYVSHERAPSRQRDASELGRANEWKPVDKGSSPDVVLRSEIPSVETESFLDSYTGPLHAFPSAYPPAPGCEPFSFETRNQVFSALQWARRPNNSPLETTPVDIDDLVDRFTLLTVRDTHPKRSQKQAVSHSVRAATCSATIKPPPAPHPALVTPITITSSFPCMTPLPIVRASQPASEVFAAYTVLPTPTSPTAPPERTSNRKYVPLPKRHPRRSPLPYRGMTPATSEASSSPSPSSSISSLSDSSDFRKGESPSTSCVNPMRLASPLFSPAQYTRSSRDSRAT